MGYDALKVIAMKLLPQGPTHTDGVAHPCGPRWLPCRWSKTPHDRKQICLLSYRSYWITPAGMGCLKKNTSFLKMPVVRRIRYVNNSCMGLTLLSLHIPTKKCIFSIDDGLFLCNCRAGVSLQPVGDPIAPGWDAVNRRMAFYAPVPSFGAGGINGRMTLAAVQTGAT